MKRRDETGAAIHWEEVRAARLRVYFFRGQLDGIEGFWTITECATERLHEVGHMSKVVEPVTEETARRAAWGIFNDATHEGISVRERAVRVLHRERDRCAFEIDAVVVRARAAAGRASD